ncbi:MAG: dihydroneopterin aldolase [Bacteroidota bacterium]|jgi:dihydroneopterin aldolase
MISYILLEHIELHAHHGVMEQEKLVGNTFFVDVKIKVDISKATYSDDLMDTISYAEVYDLIKKEMSTPSHLLEHVGGRIIRTLRATFAEIEEIELKISKRNPPTGGQIDRASILLID